MEAAAVAATRVRVAMVWPPLAQVILPVADLRAKRGDATELVDQMHYHEHARVLGSGEEWYFVQADDHYFGWVRTMAVRVVDTMPGVRVAAVPLAPLHAEPRRASPVIGQLPAGSPLSEDRPEEGGPWASATVGGRTGYVSLEDTVTISDLPHRPPTADDLLATAEAFVGVPYLWGGTTALGMDCSGYVQQVYRLNGIRLDRDAHQQAMEGRAVDVPAAGDLIFFGDEGLATHVALATGERTFLHAPRAGAKVERGELPAAGRTVLAVRRYLP